jgi:HEAT repeat protein
MDSSAVLRRVLAIAKWAGLLVLIGGGWCWLDLGGGYNYLEVRYHTARLRSLDRDEREHAASVLVQHKAITLLIVIDLLQDENAEVRVFACSLLDYVSERPLWALPHFTRALSDPNWEVRRSAAQVISQFARWNRGRQSPEIDQAIAALRKNLEGDQPRVRAMAAFALGEFRGAARPAVPTLLFSSHDPHTDVRFRAISALTRIDRQTVPQVVPLLVQLLESEYEHERWAATYSLQELGPAARDAVPALVRLLDGENAALGAEAARALGRIGPDAQLAVPALRSKWQRTRMIAAAEALRQIDPAAAAEVGLR